MLGLMIFPRMLFLLAAPAALLPAPPSWLPQLRTLNRAFAPLVRDWRHHLHKHPEPCYQEHETSCFMARNLREMGFDVTVGLAGTGLKAVLRGGLPGPVLALRADMDALPIQEPDSHAHKSLNPGMMHACGHDVHMANLLMAARMLSELREQVAGQVVFLVQPCEEGTPDGTPTGAFRMIREGALDDPPVDAVLGLHVMPGLPAGSVAIRSGALMANVATIVIDIHGHASHGAFPHEGADAIYVSALAINQFQGLLTRLRNPMDPAVLSIGMIQGGQRCNILADAVHMEGTVRSFSQETEQRIETGIRGILGSLEQVWGVRTAFEFRRMAPCVNNHRELALWAREDLACLLGEGQVQEAEPVTIGEDFAAYGQRVPSLFLFLGAGPQGRLHNPEFHPSDDVLETGGLALSHLLLSLGHRLAAGARLHPVADPKAKH